jgi:hypothetical protein
VVAVAAKSEMAPIRLPSIFCSLLWPCSSWVDANDNNPNFLFPPPFVLSIDLATINTLLV